MLHISLRDSEHIKYKPFHALLHLCLQYLCLVQVEVLDCIIAVELSHTPIPQDSPESTLAWLSACKLQAEDIIKSSGLGALIETAKEDLEKQEAVIRSLQHGSNKCAPKDNKSTAQTTGGTCSKSVNKSHMYHRLVIMTAAPEGEPYKKQLEHF